MAKNLCKNLLSLSLSLLIVLGMGTSVFASQSTLNASSTVGTLTIFSSNDGSNSSWSTSGHSFIAFKNTSSSSITVGGLSVGSTHEITFGTWGNQSNHKGIWYNLESYLINNYNAYDNRVSLSLNVTQSDINTINNLISTNDKWSATNNCSSFSTKIWNSVSSTKLSAGTIIDTPTSLISSIKSKSGYQTNRSVGNTTPIGYMSNGSFVSVTKAYSLKAFGTTVNTTEGFTEFVVPINLNPNSSQ